MINVEEVNTITRNVWFERIESGEQKAEEALPIIERCIVKAAQAGTYHTTLHIFNIRQCTELEEENAYLHKIESVLKESGFQTEFKPEARTLFIRWM